MSPPVAGTGIAAVLATFRQRQPGVELSLLELRPAQIFDAARCGTFDLGIVHHYGSFDPAGLQWTALHSYPTLLAIGGRGGERPETLDRLWSREWITGDLVDYAHGYISVLARRLGRGVPRRISRCTSISVYFDLSEQSQLVSHWAEDRHPHPALKLKGGALLAKIVKSWLRQEP